MFQYYRIENISKDDVLVLKTVTEQCPINYSVITFKYLTTTVLSIWKLTDNIQYKLKKDLDGRCAIVGAAKIYYI